MEAINTLNWMKSVAGKILGGRKKDESEESMQLTTEQQKEIKEGILKWETVITRITNTMVMSTTNSSSAEDSTSVSNKSSGSRSSSSNSETSFEDTTGSSSKLGSPSGSPLGSPSGSNSAVAGGSGTYFSDATGGRSISPSESPTNSPSGSNESATSATDGSSGGTTEASESSTSSGSDGTSQHNAKTVTEVETETSKEVMAFIMNLEKKCPQKEEYKSFFEKLKGTMVTSSKVSPEKKQGFFSRIKSAAGKLPDAMTFIRSRLGSKSAEVKKSMENYQAEVMKTVQELETIHSQIVSQNQGKKDGDLIVTTTQQTEIKKTITKWEQVTTQFVETSIKSESSSTASSSSSSSG